VEIPISDSVRYNLEGEGFWSSGEAASAECTDAAAPMTGATEAVTQAVTEAVTEAQEVL